MQEFGDRLERSTLVVTSLTAFMSPFMMSAVSVALPVIQREFAMSAVEMSWVATAYLLATAVALVPSGKIGDIYGRKKIFIIGTVVFTLASTLAAFSPSTTWLIAWRVVQGFGAAMYSTTGMAILTSVFPLQRRGQALGVYVAAVYIGLSAGPFFGGILVQHLGWPSIFLVILPMGLFCIGLTIFQIKDDWAEAKGERLDKIGSLLFACAILAIVYGITLLPTLKAFTYIGIGAVVMVAFVRLQLRIKLPVFDVSLFGTNHVFAFSSLAALINYAATAAIAFLISLYLQYIKGLSPQIAGLVLVSQPVIQAVLSPLAGRLSDRIEPRIIATAGMVMTVIGLGVFSQLDAAFPLSVVVADLVLLGVGFSLFSSPNMSAIMGAVEKRYYGIASGALATMRLLGQMLSMAVATVMLSFYVGQAAITPQNYTLFLKSVTMAFGFFTVLCTVGIYFSLSRGKSR